MSYIITNDKHYKDIAGAIRSKLRVDTKYAPEDMASAIGNIPSSADGTNNPVAGIYYTDPDENGNPTEMKLVGLNGQNVPQLFTYAQVKTTLKKVEFVDCHFTTFPNSCFSECVNLESVTIPEGIITISDKCFERCQFSSIKIPASVRTIKGWAFNSNNNIESIYLSNILQLESYAFYNCGNLATLFLPNTLKEISTANPFQGDLHIINVTIEDDFNCNALNLSMSVRYTHDTILSWFNALKDRTGETSYTLTIGNTNLKKMTEEEIAIATNKNWIIM